MHTLPPLKADLLLVHAPAVFEFRSRRDVYFPFLGTSGDVPITPLYEYFPVGFKTLKQFLGEHGYDVKLLNLSSLFLRYPNLQLETVIEAFDTRIVGLDLHWMVHVQGTLAVAEAIKNQRPDILTVLGGISATYYAQELVQLPFIDMVMRGYDTHDPMVNLLSAVYGASTIAAVPNLIFRSGDDIVDNGVGHLPTSFSCAIDWSETPAAPPRKTFQIREMLSMQTTGCAYNCGWCGGSRDSFRRIFGTSRALVRKPKTEVIAEFETMTHREGVEDHHFYSVGAYNEGSAGMDTLVESVGNSGVRSVSYEQFRLTSDDMLRKMVRACPRTSITLSPESHDIAIAKLAGRGAFTNEEMEDWIARALDLGISQIDVWYFVGMPQQDEQSVIQTVEYATSLLEKFAGARVLPMICPMIPFLDPASNFFEKPTEHGYRVFHRTANEHRAAMERASIINRINYETEALSRRDLVRVGFRAVRDLMDAKSAHGVLPGSVVKRYCDNIEDALEFIDVVHEADSLAEPGSRSRALADLGDEILLRNNIVFGGVQNQAFPVTREIGGRWFDEFGWNIADLDAAVAQA